MRPPHAPREEAFHPVDPPLADPGGAGNGSLSLVAQSISWGGRAATSAFVLRGCHTAVPLDGGAVLVSFLSLLVVVRTAVDARPPMRRVPR